MNYLEFVDSVAKESKISKSESKRLCDAVFRTLRANLWANNQVTIKGVGTFKIVDIAEREGTCSFNGKPYKVEAHKKIKFKASDSFYKVGLVGD